MDQIKNILISRGYTEKQALAVIPELLKMDDTVEGFKLSELNQKFDMTYPAALLTIDWLIKEPERAMRSINRGIK